MTFRAGKWERPWVQAHIIPSSKNFTQHSEQNFTRYNAGSRYITIRLRRQRVYHADRKGVPQRFTCSCASSVIHTPLRIYISENNKRRNCGRAQRVSKKMERSFDHNATVDIFLPPQLQVCHISSRCERNMSL